MSSWHAPSDFVSSSANCRGWLDKCPSPFTSWNIYVTVQSVYVTVQSVCVTVQTIYVTTQFWSYYLSESCCYSRPPTYVLTSTGVSVPILACAHWFDCSWIAWGLWSTYHALIWIFQSCPCKDCLALEVPCPWWYWRLLAMSMKPQWKYLSVLLMRLLPCQWIPLLKIPECAYDATACLNYHEYDLHALYSSKCLDFCVH